MLFVEINTMIININDLRNYMNRAQIDSRDVLSIMTVLRIQIEKDKIKQDYQWLNFFCNWCVHPNLQYDKLSIELFTIFYEALGNYDVTSGASITLFYDYIFEQLKNNFREVFTKYSISAHLINDDLAYSQFIILVLLIIKDRPILLPQNPSRAMQTNIEKIPALLKFTANSPELDVTPISLEVKITEKGNFDFALTTKGSGEGRRIIFNLQSIGYKGRLFQLD